MGEELGQALELLGQHCDFILKLLGVIIGVWGYVGESVRVVVVV